MTLLLRLCRQRGVLAPFPATASAEGRQFNGAPFPASVTAEGAQFNVPPSPAPKGIGRGSSSHVSPGSRQVKARWSLGLGGWVSGVITLLRSQAGPTGRLAAASCNWRRNVGSS